jgi:hypothetical protein
VCPRAVLDAVVKRKIPTPRGKSNPRTPSVQPVAQRYTDWANISEESLLTIIFRVKGMRVVNLERINLDICKGKGKVVPVLN